MGNFNSDERKKIFQKIIGLLAEEYVFPEISKQLITYLKDETKTKEYKRINNKTVFAEKLTNDLQNISKDKHLRILHNPEEVNNIRHIESQSSGEKEKAFEEYVRNQKQWNYGIIKVERLIGNVGYLKILQFADPSIAGDTLIASMQFLSETKAIIIDLRNSIGGNPRMVSLLCSFFFDQPVHLNDIGKDTFDQLWTVPYLPAKKRINTDLYVLTNKHTISGSEEFAYNMKVQKRGKIVGETTAGAANLIRRKIISDDFVLGLPIKTSRNPITGTNWELTGVVPDINSDSDRALEIAHLEALKTVLDQIKTPKLNWIIDYVRALYRPAELKLSDKKRLAGTYDQCEITLKNDHLYFSKNNTESKMIPIGKSLFGLTSEPLRSEFRIQFKIGQNGSKIKIMVYSQQDFLWSAEKNR